MARHRHRRRIPGVALALALAGCGQSAAPAPSDSSKQPISPADLGVVYGYQVVHTYPHDPGAFTEGLIMVDGSLYESTGLPPPGTSQPATQPSTLRQVDLTTGRTPRTINLPGEYFGEGLTSMGKHLYQLTWKSRKAFVYDLDTFAKTGEFAYEGEGWGLTQDGHSLIMSNGTGQIAFRDPSTFAVTRTITVRAGGKPVSMLNELEYINGEIYANVFTTDWILRINPTSGAVVGAIDARGLRSPDPRPDAVLNGIAYDQPTGRLFLTGKFSPSLYEVRLTRR